MYRFSLSLIATCLLSTAALASDAEFHPSTYTTYKKHQPNLGDVQLLSELPPVGEYIEIGVVRIATKKVSGFYDALDELKATAARHGGNAIVLEEDARIFSKGGTTDRGTRPVNATAMALIAK